MLPVKLHPINRCSRLIPSRLLLIVLGILSSSTPGIVASSFILSSTSASASTCAGTCDVIAMNGVGSRGPMRSISLSSSTTSSGSFVRKRSNTKLYNRYNPLFLAGGSLDGIQGDSTHTSSSTGKKSDGFLSSVQQQQQQQQQQHDNSDSPPLIQSPPTTSSSPKDEVATLESMQRTPSESSEFSLLGPNAHSPGWLRIRFPNFPWHRIPNLLTYLRCLAIPLFIGLFYLPASVSRHQNLYTGTTFAIASATDWLDGYLARRWDISTPFGAFLDPVADKLMVSTSLILLSGRYGSIVAIPSAIILAREIAVSALREWMAQRGERNVVKVGMQGKIKTALTMVALTVLLFVPSSLSSRHAILLYKIGIPLLYLSALITVTSGSLYFIAATPALVGAPSKK